MVLKGKRFYREVHFTLIYVFVMCTIKFVCHKKNLKQQQQEMKVDLTF